MKNSICGLEIDWKLTGRFLLFDFAAFTLVFLKQTCSFEQRLSQDWSCLMFYLSQRSEPFINPIESFVLEPLHKRFAIEAVIVFS